MTIEVGTDVGTEEASAAMDDLPPRLAALSTSPWRSPTATSPR